MQGEFQEQGQKQFIIAGTRAKIERNIYKTMFSIKKLIKWLIIGSIIGLFIGEISALFGKTLLYVNRVRVDHPQVVFGLPVAGLVIVLLYRAFKNTDDKGTNMVISSIHSSTDIPFKMAPLIFISTVLTHLCGGSAGREGAAVQLGGSIGNALGKVLRLNENDKRIIIMCALSFLDKHQIAVTTLQMICFPVVQLI